MGRTTSRRNYYLEVEKRIESGKVDRPDTSKEKGEKGGISSKAMKKFSGKRR